MKTFPVASDDGKLQVGFEIENAYATPSEVAGVLRAIAGVSEIRRGGSWLSSTDIRLTFSFNGKPFVVLEPFGDNSRYFIGPELQAPADDQIEIIENAFRAYRPSVARQLAGDVLTLRPLIGAIRIVRKTVRGERSRDR